MPATSLRVLVIGGGLGGLTLAHALRSAAISVSVFERQRAQPDPLQSYRIHINPAGSRALHACLPAHLWSAVVEHAGRAPLGIAFATEQLHQLAFVAEPPSANPVARSHPISRAGLRHLLLTDLDDVVVFDKRFVRYEDEGDAGVRAVFADGTTATGDVLVGADGSHSAVRRQHLPDARVVDTGVVGMAGKRYLDPAARKQLPRQWLDQMTMVMPPRGVGLFIAPFQRASTAAPHADVDLPDHLFWALIGHPEHVGLAAGARNEAGAALQQQALEVVARWHPAIRRLIAESDPGTLLSVPLHTAVPVAPWPPSRVTLLGDAIHTMTPLQGLGGNTALRDAALLAHHLARVAAGSADLVGAIGAYEAAMRGYAFEAVGQSLQVTQQIASPSWVARLAFKSILRLADRLPPLQRRLFQASEAA